MVDRTGRDWCILRTSGPRTLKLAGSLNDAGVEAWTPMMVTTRKRPRSRVKVERDAPILPTFVFVRAAHVVDLLAILASPVSPHPAFSIFRYGGRYPLVGDSEVASLRQQEATAADAYAAGKERGRVAALRASRPTFPTGAAVRLPQTAFASMTGVVEGRKGRAAIVNFGGGFTMTIGAWLLEPEILVGA